MSANGDLRRTVEEAAAKAGCTLDALTVLDTRVDPFRLDTPANHRYAKWLADTTAELGLGDRQIHLRGTHYMLPGQRKPNGVRYANTHRDWVWVSEKAGKAARWLGYIPWDQIVDQKNAALVMRRWQPLDPWTLFDGGTNLTVPDFEDILPVPYLGQFEGRQLYHLVFFGEKSSLEPILGLLSEEFQADLYITSGEMSDTLLHNMASASIEDGRPMVVLTFTDSDPGGQQVRLQNRTLRTAPDLPEAATLRSELLGYRFTISADGHDQYANSAREAPHDDVVLAVSMATYVADRPVRRGARIVNVSRPTRPGVPTDTGSAPLAVLDERVWRQ